MVPTVDSDNPSTCEMKDEPAFKPLQGNLNYFRGRESRYPLHVRQQIQGPSHIPIAEGSLLLKCLWKVGLLLQSKPENWTHLEMILGAQKFPRLVLNLVFL